MDTESENSNFSLVSNVSPLSSPEAEEVPDTHNSFQPIPLPPIPTSSEPKLVVAEGKPDSSIIATTSTRSSSTARVPSSQSQTVTAPPISSATHSSSVDRATPPTSKPSPPRKGVDRRHRRYSSRRSPEIDSGHCSRESGGGGGDGNTSRKSRSKHAQNSRLSHASASTPLRGHALSRARPHPYYWSRDQHRLPPSSHESSHAQKKRLSSSPDVFCGDTKTKRSHRSPVGNRRTVSPPPPPPPPVRKTLDRSSGRVSSSPPRSTLQMVTDRRTTPSHILSYLSKNLMSFSSGSLFMLCIRNNGFTFTNGFASHCEDVCPNIYKSLMYVVLSLDLGQVICTDSLTYNLLKATLETSAHQNMVRNVSYCVLYDFEQDIGVCYECNKECHRFRAVMGISKHLKFRAKFIPHNFTEASARQEEISPRHDDMSREMKVRQTVFRRLK